MCLWCTECSAVLYCKDLYEGMFYSVAALPWKHWVDLITLNVKHFPLSIYESNPRTQLKLK